MSRFVLLDSTVIFDHLLGRFGRREFLRELVLRGFVLACCSVNITETYAGLRLSEELRTEALLQSLDCLTVTPEIAKRAGLIRRDWLKKGYNLSYSDVTIASVAITHDAPLLTENSKHFPMSEI